jgi:hypothetical protein
MIQIAILSLLSTFGAAIFVAAFVLRVLPGRYLLRAAFGALLSASGVAASVFVLDGFGWGWADLSRAREVFLVVTGGLCIGLFHAAFAWIVSRRMPPLFAGSLLVANIAVLLIPSHYGMWRWTAFALANFLLVTVWLAKAQPREAAP